MEEFAEVKNTLEDIYNAARDYVTSVAECGINEYWFNSAYKALHSAKKFYQEQYKKLVEAAHIQKYTKKSEYKNTMNAIDSYEDAIRDAMDIELALDEAHQIYRVESSLRRFAIRSK